MGIFEPDHAGHPTLTQLLLDDGQQVVGVFLVGFDIGVAGDAKQVRLQDPHAGKERLQVAADDVLQADEAVVRFVVARQPDPSGQILRQLDPHEAAVARRRMFQRHAQRLAQVADERKRVPRIDRQGREDRKDLVVKELPGVFAIGIVQLRPTADSDAVLLEAGMQGLEPALHLPAQQDRDALVDERELLVGRQPVDGAGGDAGVALAVQAADALHEEFVEVVREDGQEPDAFQKRNAIVLGQLEHTLVEVEPTQLAVEEQRVRPRRGVGLGARRVGVHWVSRLGLSRPARTISGGTTRGLSDYFLRRSRRALRFFDPILRRRRGFGIGLWSFWVQSQAVKTPTPKDRRADGHDRGHPAQGLRQTIRGRSHG